MSSRKKIILFELNEVPRVILERFCAAHPDSCFARVLRESPIIDTICEDKGHLSPWITWPSLHRGVSNEVHGITSLGQDLTEQDRRWPPIWRIVKRAGLRVGVCGSLHTYPPPDDIKDFAFYIPDTFAAGPECHPNELTAFQELNLTEARASKRNVSTGIPFKAGLKFAMNARVCGVRSRTVLATISQIVAERIVRARRVRRRTLQSSLSFDLFFNQLNRWKPDFATFFTNHVASAMHRFWAAAYPGDYGQLTYGSDWIHRYRYEIDHSMMEADFFIRKLAEFARVNPEYSILVAASMGQEATHPKPQSRELLISDLDRFMSALGVPKGNWMARPAMAPQTNVLVNELFELPFEAGLKKLRVAGEPPNFIHSAQGFFSVTLGQSDVERTDVRFLGDDRAMTLESVGISNVYLDEGSGSNAYHVPQGILFLVSPKNILKLNSKTQVSTLEIAPCILNHLTIPLAGYMRQELTLAIDERPRN